MTEGAVAFLPLKQADGIVKPRPAIALRELPGFGDWLVCGVNRQLHQFGPGFDEQLSANDPDFRLTGLHGPQSLASVSFNRCLFRPSWGGSEQSPANGTVDC
jgi:mRNA interferase MazF